MLLVSTYRLLVERDVYRAMLTYDTGPRFLRSHLADPRRPSLVAFYDKHGTLIAFSNLDPDGTVIDT